MRTYSLEELAEFNKITRQASSPLQLDRIIGRMAVKHFVEKVGQEKCDAMFQVLLKRDAKKARKRRRA